MTTKEIRYVIDSYDSLDDWSKKIAYAQLAIAHCELQQLVYLLAERIEICSRLLEKCAERRGVSMK